MLLRLLTASCNRSAARRALASDCPLGSCPLCEACWAARISSVAWRIRSSADFSCSSCAPFGCCRFWAFCCPPLDCELCPLCPLCPLWPLCPLCPLCPLWLLLCELRESWPFCCCCVSCSICFFSSSAW